MPSRVMSMWAGAVAVLVSVAAAPPALSVPSAPVAAAAPDAAVRGLPPVPTKAQAVAQLAKLKMNNDAGSVEGYDRTEFQNPGEGAWKVWPGEKKCTTRDLVMARDGQQIKHTNKQKPCEVTSGRWDSPYDGKRVSYTKDADVDHIVPLKNAWQPGASTWTRTKRVELANDVVNPQLLVVVSKASNTSKGYKGPEAWKPPLASFHCTYAKGG